MFYQSKCTHLVRNVLIVLMAAVLLQETRFFSPVSLVMSAEPWEDSGVYGAGYGEFDDDMGGAGQGGGMNGGAPPPPYFDEPRPKAPPRSFEDDFNNADFPPPPQAPPAFDPYPAPPAFDPNPPAPAFDPYPAPAPFNPAPAPFNPPPAPFNPLPASDFRSGGGAPPPPDSDFDSFSWFSGAVNTNKPTIVILVSALTLTLLIAFVF